METLLHYNLPLLSTFPDTLTVRDNKALNGPYFVEAHHIGYATS